MNLPFRHAAHLAAWSVIIVHAICAAASAERRGATLAPPKPDKSDTASAAETKDIGKDWVRLKYDSSDEPIAMQTAVVRYTPMKSNGKLGSGVTVDLIGAVHIGDIGYYRK